MKTVSVKARDLAPGDRLVTRAPGRPTITRVVGEVRPGKGGIAVHCTDGSTPWMAPGRPCDVVASDRPVHA